MFKTFAIFGIICLILAATPSFAADLPDYLRWRSIEGYNGQHAYCTRVQRYYYVYRDAQGSEQTLMTYFFVDYASGDKVRFLADRYGNKVFATHFYSDKNTCCPRCAKCVKPSYQKHDYYVRGHPDEAWRKVSWSEAQKFLRARGIYVRDVTKR